MIPKIIHNTGPSNRKIWPVEWHTCFASQKKHFKDYEFMFWDDDQMEEIVTKHFSFFKPTWDQYNHQILKADMIRPMVLYLHGGIYLDLDMEVKEDVYHYLDPEKINLHGARAGDKNHPDYTNAFMASAPRNPYWVKLLHQATNMWNSPTGDYFRNCGNNRRTWNLRCFKSIFRLTGPALLSYLPETNEQHILNYGPFCIECRNQPLRHICTGSWWLKGKYETGKIHHMGEVGK